MLHAKSIFCTLGTKSILNDLSLEIKKTDFISILGPNGSGKSTLLRCLLGLIPFKGEVLLDGKDIRNCSRKTIARSIGYVPQGLGILPGFSVEQFVSIGRYARRKGVFISSKDDLAAIDKALSLTDSCGLKKQLLSSLSGGELQRVLLAATLAQEPEIILLDEPASFLDPKHEVELYQTLELLQREHNIGICMVSHSINSAAAISKRIVALQNGKIVFNGTPAKFMTNGTLQELYQTDFSLISNSQNRRSFAIARFLNHGS